MGAEATDKTLLMLSRVRKRCTVINCFNNFVLFFMACSVLFLGVLVFARCSALIPDLFTPVTLLTPVLLAVMLSLIFHKRKNNAQVASLVDQAYATDNLFLTAVTIDHATGEYKSLVLERAEEAAKTIVPGKVRPFVWQKRVCSLVGMLALLALVLAFLPQFDPFGREQARTRRLKRRKQLETMKKATMERLKVLDDKAVAELSPEVKMLLDDLKQSFNGMKKNDFKANRNKLKEMQKNLNASWKQKNSERARDLANRRFAKQAFGMRNANENQWRKEFKKGNMDGIKKEMQRLQQMARKLAKTEDSAEKRKQLQELRKKVSQMSEFLSSAAKSKAVNAAMKRAMQQCDMGNMDPKSKQALQDMANSMKLGERELEKLGQMMRDMQQLEEGMKASNLANQLNNMKNLKNPGQDFKDMQDYQDFYNQMMQQCQNQGQGKQGQGQGQGQPAQGKGKGKKPGNGMGAPQDENPLAKTDTVKQKSKSQLQRGKILMKWKVRQLSDAGQVSEEYRSAVSEIKQEASEAIIKEDIPPGYHETIKQYFKSFDERNE